MASLVGATMGLFALASCEGGDLYELDAPDWIAQKVDSIANNKPSSGDIELEGMMEDVYTIGATDYSTGWWAQFSKDYVIPDGQVWNAQFNLNINPAATNTYKNFALIVTNDVHRGDAGYTEYGACRFDHQPSGNSEWGDVYFEAHRGDVTSSLTFGSDTDPGVDKLGGKVTLTIDRSNPNAFVINITNGTVTKTMQINEALPNLNEDASNTNIRAFLVPEGSYINFLATNIEPIGGCTDAVDKMPLTMSLSQAPKKVLLGTAFEDVVKNIVATIEFEQAVSKTVSAADLTFQVIPDLETLGLKTLVAVYNKTYKGENADTPVIATIQFEVVDKMYDSLGATDNSTGWWGAHSENVKVAAGETMISSFTNYTTCANNWNNFVIVLCREDNSEYAVVRADNYGWGAGYEGNANLTTYSDAAADWDGWRAAMDGAKVTTYVTNHGDGSVDIKAVMLGTNGVTYVQEYNGIAVEAENVYYRYTVDGCHLEFDNVLGADDNTTGWWGAHSENVNVPAGHTVSMRFTNYTPVANNWNNFVVVLCREDNSEYAVVRADNYGWGAGYEGNENLTTYSDAASDWDTWRAAMDEAKVTVSVTNVGDGTTNIHAVMVGNNGQTYVQEYNGIATPEVDDIWFRFTVDGCHLVFE